MSALNMERLFRMKALLKNAADDIVIIYSEKGIEPFKKPLLFALPILLAIYAVVYAPLRSKLGYRSAELVRFEVISQNYQEYTNAKSRLSLYRTRMPLLKDKGEWLNYLINASAKKNDISLDSLSSQDETEIGGFLVASRSVNVTTSYAKLGVWLADMENSLIFIKVTDLSLKRGNARVGEIQVNLKLSTVFTRQGEPASSPGGGV